MPPYLNVCRISSEKPNYTENTSSFEHDVHLLYRYRFPWKLTINADYEHQ